MVYDLYTVSDAHNHGIPGSGVGAKTDSESVRLVDTGGCLLVRKVAVLSRSCSYDLREILEMTPGSYLRGRLGRV
jgi:hypothetical protein